MSNKNHEAATSFTVDSKVSFQTAGKSGVSVVRKGVVVGHRVTGRGTWVEVSEEGAAEGIVVATRASLVKAR